MTTEFSLWKSKDKALPDTITVDGRAFPIHADFRTILKILAILADPEIIDAHRSAVAAKYLFVGKVPSAPWWDAFGAFLRCGDTPRPASGKRDFDYEFDAPEIYASFRIDNPANNSFVLGAERSSYTQQVQQGAAAQQASILHAVASEYATTSAAHIIAQEEIQQDTTIIQRAESIIVAALEQYTKTSDFETLQSTVLTELSVLAGQVEINFTETTDSISNLSGQTQRQFAEIQSFIRYIAETSTVNGGVVIGESTSAVKLKLENDILYFFTGDETTVSTQNAIAYFAAGKLYVNTAQIQQLTIGVSGQLMDFYVAGSGDNRCIMFSGRLV